MRWLAVATALLCACSLDEQWRSVAARPVTPATTISRVPAAKRFVLVPDPSPDPGCPVSDSGTRMGDLNPKITIYRLCFPGLRRQFEQGVTAMLSGVLTPGETSPDYVVRVRELWLRTANAASRGERPYHYELEWEVEIVDRQGAVIVDVKNLTPVPGGTMSYAVASAELDERLAQSVFATEGMILDTIRTTVLASSAMQ